MIPAEKLFRASHTGEGYNLVTEIEAGKPRGVEGENSLLVKFLQCKPCDAILRIPFIVGIYWDPFRETG